LNDWLYKVYNELKNKDSADYYFRKKTGLENELKEQEFNISIHEIDTKYKVHEKELKIILKGNCLCTMRIIKSMPYFNSAGFCFGCLLFH